MNIQSHKSTFTLPGFIVEELDNMAKELGLKKSHMVSEALSQYFDRLDLEVALKRSKEVKKGITKTVTLDEIKKELNLS
jgi:predicted DNA-binding protein